jgi:hypothetical protein
MWLRIFLTFILSSHSHHLVWRLNLVTDISSPSKNCIFSKKINRRFYEKCDLEYLSLSFFHLIRIISFEDGIWLPTYEVHQKCYIFKENQSRILWEMWLRIFFTFILSSHSHHFVWRLNLVTDISSVSKNFIFLKKINRRFYEKCDLEYFSLLFFHLVHIISFEDWNSTVEDWNEFDLWNSTIEDWIQLLKTEIQLLKTEFGHRQSSLSKNCIFLKKINRRFYNKHDLVYF